jgi:hypothetical protein
LFFPLFVVIFFFFCVCVCVCLQPSSPWRALSPGTDVDLFDAFLELLEGVVAENVAQEGEERQKENAASNTGTAGGIECIYDEEGSEGEVSEKGGDGKVGEEGRDGEVGEEGGEGGEVGEEESEEESEGEVGEEEGSESGLGKDAGIEKEANADNPVDVRKKKKTPIRRRRRHNLTGFPPTRRQRRDRQRQRNQQANPNATVTQSDKKKNAQHNVLSSASKVGCTDNNSPPVSHSADAASNPRLLRSSKVREVFVFSLSLLARQF